LSRVGRYSVYGGIDNFPDPERTDPPLPPTRQEFFGILNSARLPLALGLCWGRVTPGAVGKNFPSPSRTGEPPRAYPHR